MLYIECRILFCVQTALISVTFVGHVLPRYVVDKYIMNKANIKVVPWVGVLKFIAHEDGKTYTTGVILIAKGVAIANAKDISKIDKETIEETTKAMFISVDNHMWKCPVMAYTLHHEFGEITLNTLALLHLDYDTDLHFGGETLEWPIKVSTSYLDVFAFGFIQRRDQTRIFEQVIYRMEYVNFDDCKDFYINEQLDTKWMLPTSYKCYRKIFSTEPCVYESGMALAVNVSGKWTLLGMSTWGPGCTLPSRFITFSRFIPWIVIKLGLRRNFFLQPSFSETIDTEEDNHIAKLEKITANTVVMRPLKNYFVESFGACGGNASYNEYLMYQEEAKYSVPEYGLGTYTFSINDFNFEWKDWNCILIKAGSSIYYKSETDAWHDKDMEEESATEPKLSNFIRIYPVRRADRRVPPKGLQPKVWQNYNFFDTRHINFYFEFYKEGNIKIRFYSPYADKAIKKPVTTTRARLWQYFNFTFKRRPYKAYHSWPVPPTSVTTTTTKRKLTFATTSRTIIRFNKNIWNHMLG